MGGGAVPAACMALGTDAVGIEIDELYFGVCRNAVPQLAALYPSERGDFAHRQMCLTLPTFSESDQAVQISAPESWEDAPSTETGEASPPPGGA